MKDKKNMLQTITSSHAYERYRELFKSIKKLASPLKRAPKEKGPSE